VAETGAPPVGHRPSFRLPAVVRLFVACLAALAAAGCVETEEAWTFDSTGAGTYALTVRWNADVWSRVGGIFGADALRRVEGRSFPLHADEWRDGLRGLEGVTVEALAEKDLPGGVREISVHLRFRRVQDLLKWEVLSRRSIRIDRQEDGNVRLRMEPLARVAVVDRLAAIQAVRDGTPGGTGRLPPPVLADLGVREEDAQLVATMLKPYLDRMHFTFSIETPGPMRTIGDAPVADEKTKATFEFTFDDFVKGRDRSLRCTWRPLALDRPPSVEHVGDAAPPVVLK
jgi:hypothetical protein